MNRLNNSNLKTQQGVNMDPLSTLLRKRYCSTIPGGLFFTSARLSCCCGRRKESFTFWRMFTVKYVNHLPVPIKSSAKGSCLKRHPTTPTNIHKWDLSFFLRGVE
ncbi:hypothetical protein TNIN_166751 [Trichonephila inaurata madagascariensis]|uniref:Uncharacterized protein n=1 Tax=Trichonephila inaurata madagascariensis TaxID=2747483 RepID=A0A8X7BXS9_9ARAC|nr:hypothetical protein TNIN_166751 [Trichonephila inaurata madagascariensis]